MCSSLPAAQQTSSVHTPLVLRKAEGRLWHLMRAAVQAPVGNWSWLRVRQDSG